MTKTHNNKPFSLPTQRARRPSRERLKGSTNPPLKQRTTSHYHLLFTNFTAVFETLLFFHVGHSRRHTNDTLARVPPIAKYTMNSDASKLNDYKTACARMKPSFDSAERDGEATNLTVQWVTRVMEIPLWWTQQGRKEEKVMWRRRSAVFWRWTSFSTMFGLLRNLTQGKV